MHIEKQFSTDIDIRFRDIDAMGHVNNAVYFTYWEEGRKGFFYNLIGKTGVDDLPFILAHVSCDYLKPVKVENQVSVKMMVGEIGTRRFDFIYRLVDRSDGSIVYAKGESVQVCYDYRKNRTIDISEELRQILSEYQVR